MTRRTLRFVLVVVAASWSVTHAGVRTVTNTNDSGPGCLRECIEHALPGDEIRFDPSLDGQPIVLSGRELTINRDLTISGRGADKTILDANHESRVVNVWYGRELPPVSLDTELG